MQIKLNEDFNYEKKGHIGDIILKNREEVMAFDYWLYNGVHVSTKWHGDVNYLLNYFFYGDSTWKEGFLNESIDFYISEFEKNGISKEDLQVIYEKTIAQNKTCYFPQDWLDILFEDRLGNTFSIKFEEVA